MSQQPAETREQEIARVRNYFASQSMKRTPAQLVDALREAHQQFLQATNAIPDDLFSAAPKENEWTAIDVLKHVVGIAKLEEHGICTVIEQGQRPTDVYNVPSTFEQTTKESLLAMLNTARDHLIAVVLQADPHAHLDILWQGSEFGLLNWREWLLFARVHTLDHARQMQAIGTALLPQRESTQS